MEPKDDLDALSNSENGHRESGEQQISKLENPKAHFVKKLFSEVLEHEDFFTESAQLLMKVGNYQVC